VLYARLQVEVIIVARERKNKTRHPLAGTRSGEEGKQIETFSVQGKFWYYWYRYHT
jgi:hypothetical protein